MIDFLNSLMNKKEEFKIKLIPDIVPELEDKRKNFLIYGDMNADKSKYINKLMELNSNKTFLFIDAFYIMKINRENVLTFISNSEDEIIECIKELPKGAIDILLINGINSLTSCNESWDMDSLRYEEVVRYIYRIITACNEKNILFIAVNNENANGTNSNISNQLLRKFDVILKIVEDKVRIEKNIFKGRY